MRPGEVVANRFELEHLAGSGGMGAVWRARDRETGGTVALKVMLAHTTDRARFVREAEVLARLRHDAIVRYVAHGVTDDGLSYLAMQWLEGCDLATRLARGPVRLSDTLAMAILVAEALGEGHARGVVHRDVKPANIFLPGERLEDATLIDFGIAYIQAITHTTGAIGTIGYMAPEQARRGSSLDARTDVFSLGCVIFECLVGRPVFTGAHAVAILAKVLVHEPPRLSEVLVGVPPELDELVARMLEKEPANRPADAREVAQALRAMVLDPKKSLAPQLARRQPSLSAEELRVASVVLVGRAGERGDVPTVAAGDAQRDAERLSAEAAKFGARAFRLVDGSVLAVAIADVPSDQAAQAARCALALRRLLADRGAAIATGRAALDRKVPLGEVIDAAAAMLRAGDASGIRIDDATAGLLGARFDIQDGFLVAERDALFRARTLLGKSVPCVGRDRELAALDGLLRECIDEPVARVALVTGAAGCGKSRVVQELALRARDSDVGLWHGAADAMSGRSPLSVLADALRRAIGLRAGAPLPEQRATLRAHVAATVPHEPDRVTWFLGEMLGVPFDAHESAQLAAARGDARLMADQVRRAFEDFALAAAATRPLLWVLEDLQWTDSGTLALVDSTLRRAAELPLMVVATARSDFRERFGSLWAERHIQEIKLGALSPRAGGALVRTALPSADDGAIQRLVDRSEGNALFLEELVRAEAEGRGDHLPGSVLAMVVARIERLPPDLRRMLRAASVFGRSFWGGAVRALVDVDAESFDAGLGELIASELVVELAECKFPNERELAFRHALTRDAAYGMLTPADAALGHRLAGEWLENAGETDARSLAGHFETGGEPARASAAYLRAATQALAANDLGEVVALADRGVACGATGEALGTFRLLQAQSHFWRGAPAEAYPLAVAALESLARGTPEWSRAVGLVGNLEARRAHFDG
ncbi:MAG TPA: protein kinase, partial [Polyangiaceae bacterium]|nr:protein kinase [Polyangiaceae bacterium]